MLSLAVNYEGNMVVSGNQRGEVGVWDVVTGSLLKPLCHMNGRESGGGLKWELMLT